MILTGPEIIAARERGELVVEPFDPSAVDPNDYLVRLGTRLLVCTADRLDAQVAPEVKAEVLPESGRVLQPGRLYLGETAEVIGGRSYASTLDTARSVAELGLWIQVMAPLGHVGAVVRWTLELVVAQPLRVTSVTAVELCNRLTAVTGHELPVTLVYDLSTPAALAYYLDAELPSA